MERGIKLELIEEDSERQKMLNEKMMMDPVISMILFNEYIPLARRENNNINNIKQSENDKSKNINDAINEISKKVDGLVLKQVSTTTTAIESDISILNNDHAVSGGLFIRSDLPQNAPQPAQGGGLFLRSGSNVSNSSQLSDDWVMF